MPFSDIAFIFMIVGWISVYVLSLISIYKYKDQIIPALAVAMNFPWEVVALIYTGRIMYIAAVVLDSFIYMFCISTLRKKKERKAIARFAIVSALSLAVSFITFSFTKFGWLDFSFWDALIMSVMFLYEPNQYINRRLITLIAAIARLIGNFGAWQCNTNNSVAVFCGPILLLLESLHCFILLSLVRKNSCRQD